MERKGLVQFAGKEVTIIGSDLKVGEKAPEFVAYNNEWEKVNVLAPSKGKVRIIGALLSLSTSVCDRETRKFNLEAEALGEDVVVFMLSMDLPFTQKDWCGAAGMERVITLSDQVEADFGTKYGVLIKELRFLRRAIFVVDKEDKIVYASYMKELGDEPDYKEVLKAARAALK
jgi:thiol peroxidase